MRLPTVLVALMLAAAAYSDEPKQPKPAPKSVEGFWEGALHVGVIDLRLAFTIKSKDGKLTATMDSVDQGAFGIPIDTVTFADGKLELADKKLTLTYSAKLSDDGSKLVGEWKQRLPLPLELMRVDKLTGLNRPQHPKKPYPYDEEEVVVENKAAGVKLAGTLTKPKGDGPFPATVMITGSGQQDRDETLLGHKPFLVIADHLTRHGIAVLRCDDRGAGKSTGDFAKSTTADFATDTAACVNFLKGHKAIDPKRIGLIGHSEGGIIAPMVAAERSDIAFIVLLAGPGTTGEEILIAQGQAILKALKVDEKLLAWQRETQEKLIAQMKGGADEAKLRAAFREQIEKMPEEERKKAGKLLEAAVDQQIKMASSRWLVELIKVDNREFLKKVRCPVLALNGGKDLQVPAKENLEGIEKAAKAGGNLDVTVKELPELNHLFQTAKTGAPNEYGRIEETFAPAALELTTEWIVNRVGKP